MHEFRSLVKSPGWVRLVELANNQIALRAVNSQTRIVRNLEDMADHNAENGESRGIKLFTQLPETAIAQWEQQLELLNQEIEDDDES